jgi:hypothetical protein
MAVDRSSADECTAELRRPPVEQGGVPARRVVILLVELRQSGGDGAALRRDLGEPALQRRGPFGVEVVVASRLVRLQLLDEIRLGSAELIQLLAQGCPLRG